MNLVQDTTATSNDKQRNGQRRDYVNVCLSGGEKLLSGCENLVLSGVKRLIGVKPLIYEGEKY